MFLRSLVYILSDTASKLFVIHEMNGSTGQKKKTTLVCTWTFPMCVKPPSKRAGKIKKCGQTLKNYKERPKCRKIYDNDFGSRRYRTRKFEFSLQFLKYVKYWLLLYNLNVVHCVLQGLKWEETPSVLKGPLITSMFSKSGNFMKAISCVRTAVMVRNRFASSSNEKF